jgi:3-carboxy-cis,cis-muconate cycloisomerase
MELLDQLFRSPEVEKSFSSRACLQGMLDFEAALARAEARAGVIASSAAKAIAAKCKAELFDAAAIAQSAKLAGNLAIPLVKALTTQVASSDKDAARYVHWGATSQDVIDTGLVLQLRDALKFIDADLGRVIRALENLAVAHRSTITVGRTWMQQALPTTFGAKVASWLDALQRSAGRIPETRQRALVLQFGGAVGTRAALGGRGAEVAKILSEELQLGLPPVPWHSGRDRVAEVATTLGLCVGTLGKIARDISLLAQTEIGEVAEPSGDGRGGSSTMPHKRNPVTTAVVLSAAMRVPGLVNTMLSAMVQEHERGLGGWHAEWETLPEIVGLTAGALHQMAEMLPRLEVDTDRMRQNLEATRGLIYAEAVSMALAEKIGKSEAHRLVEAAAGRALKQRRYFREILADDSQVTKHVTPGALAELFEPQNYLGEAEAFVDRVVGERNKDVAPQKRRS